MNRNLTSNETVNPCISMADDNQDIPKNFIWKRSQRGSMLSDSFFNAEPDKMAIKAHIKSEASVAAEDIGKFK